MISFSLKKIIELKTYTGNALTYIWIFTKMTRKELPSLIYELMSRYNGEKPHFSKFSRV